MSADRATSVGGDREQGVGRGLEQQDTRASFGADRGSLWELSALARSQPANVRLDAADLRYPAQICADAPSPRAGVRRICPQCARSPGLDSAIEVPRFRRNAQNAPDQGGQLAPGYLSVLGIVEGARLSLSQGDGIGLGDVVDVRMAPTCQSRADIARNATLARILDEMRQLHALAPGPNGRPIDEGQQITMVRLPAAAAAPLTARSRACRAARSGIGLKVVISSMMAPPSAPAARSEHTLMPLVWMKVLPVPSIARG